MALDIFAGTSFLSFYGFLLPWIFSFAIVYGLLIKTNIFGGANRTVSIALAFVIAFFVTGVGGPQLALFFVNLFGGASVFLAGILVLILFLSLLGHTTYTAKWAAAIVILIGIFLFVTSGGAFSGFVFLDAATASIIFWLIIIAVAAYLITREGGAGAAAPEKPPEKK